MLKFSSLSNISIYLYFVPNGFSRIAVKELRISARNELQNLSKQFLGLGQNCYQIENETYYIPKVRKCYVSKGSMLTDLKM